MITLTEKAIDFFDKQYIKLKNTYCVVSLKKVGCSGYQYTLAWTDEAHGLMAAQGEWFICMDPTWAAVLQTLIIDMEEDSLGQKKLVFNNAQTHAWCGCGESFMVNDAAI